MNKILQNMNVIFSKYNKLISNIIAILAIAIFLFIVYNGLKEEKEELREIKLHPAITWATIYEVNDGIRTTWYYNYKFVVNGITYQDSRSSRNSTCENQNCRGMQYKVIYSKKDPSKNRLLISEKDYNEFYLTRPVKYYKRKY